MPVDAGTLIAFAAATALLILTPGPTVALIIANTLAGGARAGLTTVAGAASALSVHLILVVIGLSAMLAALGQAVFWLKWAGALYLVYLGVKALRAPPPALEARPSNSKRVFAEAFFVTAFNPKVLIFYAAFFPLFVSSVAPAIPQLAVLSMVFWIVAVSLDTGWALTASRARPVLVRLGRWLNRLSGGVLIATGAVLAAARRA